MLRHINILAEIIASQPNNLTYDNGFLEYVSVSKGKQKYVLYAGNMVHRICFIHCIIDLWLNKIIYCTSFLRTYTSQVSDTSVFTHGKARPPQVTRNIKQNGQGSIFLFN